MGRAQNCALLQGDGSFRFEVVGEASYQDALQRAAGGRQREGVNHRIVAVLLPEPENRYDPSAVAVKVGVETVGYLPRKIAPRFLEALSGQGYDAAACHAMIVGGWDRGRGDKGHFGIYLDATLAFELEAVDIYAPDVPPARPIPEGRHVSAAELATIPVKAASRPKRRRGLPIGALIACALIALGIFSHLKSVPEPPPIVKPEPATLAPPSLEPSPPVVQAPVDSRLTPPPLPRPRPDRRPLNLVPQ